MQSNVQHRKERHVKKLSEILMVSSRDEEEKKNSKNCWYGEVECM